MKKTTLVFVPAPARGHIASTIEFAKRLLERDERISITVLVMNLPGSHELTSYVEELAASNPSIQFIPLPKIDPPEPMKSIENFISLVVVNHKFLVKDAIVEHVFSNPNNQLGGLVVDMFCTSMIDVANELAVPAYVFLTSGAALLGLLLHLPSWYTQVRSEFTTSGPDSIIPAYSQPVPSRVLPSFFFDKDGCSTMASHGIRFKEAKGIIINTFAELELYAIKSLTLDQDAPPIYTVGPVLNFEMEKCSESEQIIEWLDAQPSSSVVFLCFGSMGGFEPPQLAEIAAALERSGKRFLWSVRAPPPKDFTTKRAEFTNFYEILPQGFLERTQNRGLVCGWVPQVEVLAHKAVGGFVSHCGWNSVLESIWNGVPIATWPVYAEQQSNAFELVKELGIAVELTLDYRSVNPDRLVMANEIENAIRCLMESENPVRKRVKEMGEMSRKVLVEGGSSFVSLGRFIEDITVSELLHLDH